MPELPEVETVRRQLLTVVKDRMITGVNIRYAPIIQGDSIAFIYRLTGQTIHDIGRYGKYLLFHLDDVTLVSHLRMEGKYFYRKHSDALTKHDHIIFNLDNDYDLTYHDVRKFGTMELINLGDAFLLPSISKLGPEVNDQDIDVHRVYHQIHQSHRAIKSLLLDQTIVCGLGNIYVDETLFRAKLHPETQGKNLTYQQVEDILYHARAVIEKAINLGGTTIRTYQSTLGIDGRFQNELNVHTLKGEPCPVCSTKIKKIKVGGRGTYYCPHCQQKGEI